MKQKKEFYEAENLLLEKLNADKPSKRVLNSAKQIMLEQQEKNAKRSYFLAKRWKMAAVASCIVMLLAVSCILPYIANISDLNDHELQRDSISSIQDYNNILSDNILSLDYEIIGTTLYYDVIDGNAVPVYIQEDYLIGKQIVTLYVLIGDTDYTPIFMDDFVDLQISTQISDLDISYTERVSGGYASFQKDRYYYFVMCDAGDTPILAYVSQLING